MAKKIDAEKLKKDLLTLHAYLQKNYGPKVCDNVFRIMDRKLSLKGKLLDVLAYWLTSKVQEKLIGGPASTVLTVVDAFVLAGGYGARAGHKAFGKAFCRLSRNMNPYSPASSPDQYVSYLLYAYKHEGVLKYMAP